MSKLHEPIIVKQAFNCTAETLWSAITNLEQMRQWYFPMLESFEAKLGFQTKFIVQNEGRTFTHLWKITEATSLKTISYEWRFREYQGLGLSTFGISEVDGQRVLTLTSNTLESFPEGIPEFQRQSAVDGWNYLIGTSLKNFLNQT